MGAELIRHCTQLAKEKHGSFWGQIREVIVTAEMVKITVLLYGYRYFPALRMFNINHNLSDCIDTYKQKPKRTNNLHRCCHTEIDSPGTCPYIIRVHRCLDVLDRAVARRKIFILHLA
jgi:hypothetical protein